MPLMELPNELLWYTIEKADLSTLQSLRSTNREFYAMATERIESRADRLVLQPTTANYNSGGGTWPIRCLIKSPKLATPLFIYRLLQKFPRRVVADCEPCPQMRHGFMFSRLHSVNLRGFSRLRDVSCLGNLHSVDLTECKSVRDVSGLCSLHTLNLTRCERVSDVSALGGLHGLNLQGCFLVSDISSLGKLHALKIGECRLVTDVSSLGGLHTLDAWGCYAITDVSALGNLYDLSMAYCDLTNVSALGSLHTLCLRNNERLSDVSSLGNVHTLDLTGCRQVKDISQLGRLHTLSLEKCAVENVRALGGLHTLNLKGCFRVQDVSSLGGLHTLKLRKCTGVRDISALGSLHSLDIRFSGVGNILHHYDFGERLCSSITELIRHECECHYCYYANETKASAGEWLKFCVGKSLGVHKRDSFLCRCSYCIEVEKMRSVYLLY